MDQLTASELKRSQLYKLLGWGLLGMVLLVLLRTAWLCDDAYISYRCIDNLVSGHGFGYNAGERVQAYTHPLWALLHVPFYAIARAPYLWGLLLALGTSIATVLLLNARLVTDPLQRCFVLVALVCSQAWVDYATSGLENPLSHLLIVWFCIVWFGPKMGLRRLQWLTAIAALAMLNRMDTILLFAPAVALSFWQVRSWRALGSMVVAASPLIGWEVFATLYYGFPFPNTAYAKLNVALSKGTIYMQGLKYYVSVLLRDPFTLLPISAALGVAFWQRKQATLPLALGLLLYLLYIVRIGGDFMLGRFFTSGFLLAIILLVKSKLRLPQRMQVVGLAALALLIYLPSLYFIVRGKGYGDTEIIDSRGITDERAFYYPVTGLMHGLLGQDMPRGEWVDRGKAYADSSAHVIADYNMGFKGFYAGPEKYMIDRYALTDAFLARLPNAYRPDWKPGHFARMLPLGYQESRRSGHNQLVDPQLAELYDHLQVVTQGPIWSAERLGEIWRFNTRAYDDLVDWQRYHFPLGTQMDLSAAPHDMRDSLDCMAATMVIRQDSGVTVRLGADRSFDRVILNICDQCSCLIHFRHGDALVGTVGFEGTNQDAMRRVEATCEQAWQAQGIDNIVIQHLGEENICGLGGIGLE